MFDSAPDSLCVLTVNPGSTSAKVTLFRGADEVASYEISKKHQSGLEGAALDREVDAYVDEIKQFMSKQCDLSLDAVVGRGGFVDRRTGPVSSGIYEVAIVTNGQVQLCKDIIRAVTENPELDHASNLGIPIAARLAVEYSVPAFCVDPVVADDFTAEARYSGYKPIQRKSTAHALSVKMLGKMTADALGKSVTDTRMVVVHMGGGITVAAVKGGLMVDNNIALLGGGPFTPQRVGTLPMSALIDLCFDSGMTKNEIKVELTKRGGLTSYLGDADVLRITERIEAGDTEARSVLDAMSYQIAKEIGAMAVAAGAPLDALVFSGGLARSELFMDMLRVRISHLAPLHIFPGSVEMKAMARGAIDVLTGNESAIAYYLPRQR
ncbi:butyrate kinase [bacterium F16]|nr:butyrate kinase [bacterium F16]